jgi:hypothetical protein
MNKQQIQEKHLARRAAAQKKRDYAKAWLKKSVA